MGIKDFDEKTARERLAKMPDDIKNDIIKRNVWMMKNECHPSNFVHKAILDNIERWNRGERDIMLRNRKK